MSSNTKVLTGLIERRALEAALTDLGNTTAVDALVERASVIAQQGSAVVPVLLSMLDTSDPQLRGGLGQVAAQLDPDEIVPALRAAARSRERSDQARLTALMILQRFLQQPVDDSLLVGLQDPDAVALQSLRELAHEMERNPFVVTEYLNQLAEQPPDVAQTLLSMVPRLPPHKHLITLLRMFAQGEDLNLAQLALDQLSRARSVDSARALAGLSATLPPPLAALAGRGLRKLRLSGISYNSKEHPTPAWRALLSPVDGAGAQVVWFTRALPDGEHGVLFSILYKDPDGVVASFGSMDVPLADLPPAQAYGATYMIQQSEAAPPINMLEVPFDAGRQTVADALVLNWESGHALPMEYQLLNGLIWEEGPLGGAALPAAEPAGVAHTPAQVSALLDHPAMESWFWQAPQLYDAAEKLGRRHPVANRLEQMEILIHNHFTAEHVSTYRRRLHRMATWFALAAQPEAATLARAAEDQLANGPAAESSFVQRLVSLGLDIAVANLYTGFDLRRMA